MREMLMTDMSMRDLWMRDLWMRDIVRTVVRWTVCATSGDARQKVACKIMATKNISLLFLSRFSASNESLVIAGAVPAVRVETNVALSISRSVLSIMRHVNDDEASGWTLLQVYCLVILLG